MCPHPDFYPSFDDTTPALVLLPEILPQVSEASVDTIVDFLQVVQDHPLLKYADPTGSKYDLYKAATEAAEKILTPELIQVSSFLRP